MALQVEVREITPQEAAQILEQNTRNRSVRHRKVEMYARDMREHRWRENGESIKFNGDGTLYDGQHRLLACVLANTSFTTLVVRGLRNTAHSTIDVGATRTMGDELRWLGETNPNELAAALRLAWSYDKSDFSNNTPPSRGDLLAFLKKYPDVRSSLRGIKVAKAVGLQRSPFCAALFIMQREHGPERVDEFLASLAGGTGYEEGDPCLALRTYAVNVAGTRKFRPTPIDWLAITLKAMNHWLAGRAVKNLSWRRVGPKKEPFPQIVSKEEVGDF